MEISLRASQYGGVFEGRLPTSGELQNITEELGLDMATQILLKTIQDSPLHGEFGRRMRSIDPGDASHRQPEYKTIEVAFVASNHFMSGRKWGDHVEPWRIWARHLGFTTELIETKARFSVAENARVIRDFLTANPHSRRIVVTYGQGTSEFRYLLHRLKTLGAFHETEGLKGWMSVNGTFAGSSFAQYTSERRLRRWNEQMKLRWAGRNPSVMLETASGFGLWRQPAPIAREMTTVSLIGLPQRVQIPNGLHFSYNLLAKSQPNDGVCTFVEAVAHPGFIVPITGMNHRAEEYKLKPHFQRSLMLLGNSIVASIAASGVSKEKSPSEHPTGLSLDLE